MNHDKIAASILRKSIFVFGSNLAGIHGKGAASFAEQFKGAVRGQGVGRTGQAYALPTKNEKIKTLSLDVIAGYIEDFINHARKNPNTFFQLTRIGCGEAGYSDDAIRPLFKDAPRNVLKPGVWRVSETNIARLIVAGSREFTDTGIAHPILGNVIESLSSEYKTIEIVHGDAPGADTLGKEYAKKNQIKFHTFEAEWDRYRRETGNHKIAGAIRNQEMSWYGTHLLAFHCDNSPGTAKMIKVATNDKLTTMAAKIQHGQFKHMLLNGKPVSDVEPAANQSTIGF